MTAIMPRFSSVVYMKSLMSPLNYPAGTQNTSHDNTQCVLNSLNYIFCVFKEQNFLKKEHSAIVLDRLNHAGHIDDVTDVHCTDGTH